MFPSLTICVLTSVGKKDWRIFLGRWRGVRWLGIVCRLAPSCWLGWNTHPPPPGGRGLWWGPLNEKPCWQDLSLPSLSSKHITFDKIESPLLTITDWKNKLNRVILNHVIKNTSLDIHKSVLNWLRVFRLGTFVTSIGSTLQGDAALTTRFAS